MLFVDGVKILSLLFCVGGTYCGDSKENIVEKKPNTTKAESAKIGLDDERRNEVKRPRTKVLSNLSPNILAGQSSKNTSLVERTREICSDNTTKPIEKKIIEKMREKMEKFTPPKTSSTPVSKVSKSTTKKAKYVVSSKSASADPSLQKSDFKSGYLEIPVPPKSEDSTRQISPNSQTKVGCLESAVLPKSESKIDDSASQIATKSKHKIEESSAATSPGQPLRTNSTIVTSPKAKSIVSETDTSAIPKPKSESNAYYVEKQASQKSKTETTVSHKSKTETTVSHKSNDAEPTTSVTPKHKSETENIEISHSHSPDSKTPKSEIPVLQNYKSKTTKKSNSKSTASSPKSFNNITDFAMDQTEKPTDKEPRKSIYSGSFEPAYTPALPQWKPKPANFSHENKVIECAEPWVRFSIGEERDEKKCTLKCMGECKHWKGFFGVKNPYDDEGNVVNNAKEVICFSEEEDMFHMASKAQVYSKTTEDGRKFLKCVCATLLPYISKNYITCVPKARWEPVSESEEEERKFNQDCEHSCKTMKYLVHHRMELVRRVSRKDKFLVWCAQTIPKEAQPLTGACKYIKQISSAYKETSKLECGCGLNAPPPKPPVNRPVIRTVFSLIPVVRP